MINNGVIEGNRNSRDMPQPSIPPEGLLRFNRGSRINDQNNSFFDYRNSANNRSSFRAAEMRPGQSYIDNQMSYKQTYEQPYYDDRNRIDIVISSPKRYLSNLRKPVTVVESKNFGYKSSPRQSTNDQCELSDNSREIFVDPQCRGPKISNWNSKQHYSSIVPLSGPTNYRSSVMQSCDETNVSSERPPLIYNNDNYNRFNKNVQVEQIKIRPTNEDSLPPRLSFEEFCRVRQAPIEAKGSTSEIPTKGVKNASFGHQYDGSIAMDADSKEFRKQDELEMKAESKIVTDSNTKDSDCSSNSLPTKKVTVDTSTITDITNNTPSTQTGCPLFSPM